MSVRFRPTSRNQVGGKFWEEFYDWSLKVLDDWDKTLGRKVMADGAPPGHTRTSDAQQLALLRAARDKQDPMFTNDPRAQKRLAELESRSGAQQEAPGFPPGFA